MYFLLDVVYTQESEHRYAEKSFSFLEFGQIPYSKLSSHERKYFYWGVMEIFKSCL